MSRHHHITVLATAWWLTQDERYAEAAAAQLRSWWSANPSAQRGALDERDRGRHPADLLDLDPPAARRLAQGGRPVRAQRRRRPADRLAPGVPGRLPQPGLLGQQPRRRRSGRPAGRRLRVPLVRPEPANGGPARRSCWSGSSPPTPSPTVSTVSWPPTTTASCSSSGWWPPSRPTRTGTPLSEATWTRLAQMLDAAAAMVDVTGRPPRQGDGDEGRALVVDDPERDPWATLLSTGVGPVGRAQLVAFVRERDPGGPVRGPRAGASAPAPRRATRPVPQGRPGSAALA